MCIIVYKNEVEKFPTKETLKTCFENNPDGAGFMYAYNKKVYIEKGLMTFNKFWKALQDVRKKIGDNVPYVLHFRISTQAGRRNDCTHPYPLSDRMEDLRKLSTTTNIGIAHNGIISLTSTGYSYTKTITYNDTMEFITDYLSLIIKNKDYYKDKDTLTLIERLCESKLAILDEDGHCQIIGKGWILENGIFYSNTSYLAKKVYYNSSKTTTSYLTDFGEEDDGEFYEPYGCAYYKGDKAHEKTKMACTYCAYYDSCFGDAGWEYEDYKYEYEPLTCPVAQDGDDSYCYECKNYEICYGIK